MADFPYKDPDNGSVRPYKGAALFVRGSESKYVADDVLPVVGRFFPLFEVADVKAGHWVISQNPADFRRGTYVGLQVCIFFSFFLLWPLPLLSLFSVPSKQRSPPPPPPPLQSNETIITVEPPDPLTKTFSLQRR